jgi:Tfp pilus assembly protein PilO
LMTTLELEGDYRAIRRFIYLVETAPEFTIIQNVTLAQSQQRGSLQLTLSLTTYYWTPSHAD